MLFFFPPDMARPASLIGDSQEHQFTELTSGDGQPVPKTDRVQPTSTASPSMGGIRQAAHRPCCDRLFLRARLLPGFFEHRRRQTHAAASGGRTRQPRPDEALIGEVKGIGRLVEDLKDQLRSLQGKIDGFPEPTPAEPETDADEDRRAREDAGGPGAGDGSPEQARHTGRRPRHRGAGIQGQIHGPLGRGPEDEGGTESR